ncbi:MAG: hypothetical protein ACR2OH_04260 [Microthrixaceae bacterium]
MSNQRNSRSATMGYKWSTVSPRTAAVLRERRIQIAVDPSNGRERLTMH